MLKRNKWKIILSSLVVLLPILYGVIMWNQLPDVLTTHWGGDGVADGFGTDTDTVILLGKNGEKIQIGPASKQVVAEKLIEITTLNKESK